MVRILLKQKVENQRIKENHEIDILINFEQK
jgi:hypothetical protein